MKKIYENYLPAYVIIISEGGRDRKILEKIMYLFEQQIITECPPTL